MLDILSAFKRSSRRRRLAANRLACGQNIEQCESLVLLSAASGIATVPQAADVAVASKVAPSAKAPEDFSGHWDLNGSLGPGTMDVIQLGSDVELTISFDSQPDITNTPLEGRVKGHKLKATLANPPYDNLKKVVFKAKLNGDDFSWRISWRTV